jgi:hypothetical protein
MAYVVRRPKGRYEIRESVHTDRGPRARSLAAFVELDDDVLARAEAAAATPFRADDVRTSARRAGAVLRPSATDAVAQELLAHLRGGRRLAPGLRRLLVDQLGNEPAPSLAAGDGIADWIGASAAARGTALRDL